MDRATVVAGVTPLNKSLERTLEKIRKVEKTSPVQLFERRGKDSGEKMSPYTDRDLQKPSALAQILRERYGIDGGKRSTPTQDRDNGYTGRKQNYSEKDRSPEAAEDRPLGGYKMWETYTPASYLASRSHIQGRTSTEAKKTPYEPKSPYYASDTKKTSTQRMISEREGSDNEEIEGEKPTRRLQPQDRSFSFQAEGMGKSSHRMDIERAQKPLYSHTQSQQTFSQGSQQLKSDPYRRSSTSPYQLESEAADEELRASPKFAKTSVDKQPTGSKTVEKKKEEQGKSHSTITKSGSKEIGKSTPTAESSRGSLLNQWIDQKINGFLIFQNTLRDQAGPNVEDFTKYCSEKWFHLSKPERDEYTTLALKRRAELKQEFVDLTLDTSDLSQLQELLDQRIKTFKK